MNNYCKIYVIKSNNTDLVYVGSTTQTLEKRFYNHCNEKYNHTSSFKVLNFNDCFIELLEVCNISKRQEKEKYWINQFNSVNIQIPTRTKKEWEKDNKDKIKKYKKKYVNNNKDIVLEYRKNYDKNIRNKKKINCSCGGIYIKRNIKIHYKSKKHQKYIFNSFNQFNHL